MKKKGALGNKTVCNLYNAIALIMYEDGSTVCASSTCLPNCSQIYRWNLLSGLADILAFFFIRRSKSHHSRPCRIHFVRHRGRNGSCMSSCHFSQVFLSVPKENYFIARRFVQDFKRAKNGGGSVAEWLEPWTCNSEAPSSSPPLAASWVSSSNPRPRL